MNIQRNAHSQAETRAETQDETATRPGDRTCKIRFSQEADFASDKGRKARKRQRPDFES